MKISRMSHGNNMDYMIGIYLCLHQIEINRKREIINLKVCMPKKNLRMLVRECTAYRISRTASIDVDFGLFQI